MKVIFLGTPEFGAICLNAILQSKHEVVAVVCQPDKLAGRGNKLTVSPVKALANKFNIPVYQFQKIRIDGVDTLKSIKADIMVTAAYGQILSQEIIDICPHKIINVHGSLLPKYRGAAPIQYALLNGEQSTGVTIMKTEAGIDTGDMLLKKEIKIDEFDNYGTLSQKLAQVGAELVVKALDKIEDKSITYTPQKEEDATFTKMIKKEDEILNFNDSMKDLINKVRAFNPSPVAHFTLKDIKFKVYQLKESQINNNLAKCGEVLVANSKQGLIIKCNDGAVEVVELQPESSKRMFAKNYLNGKKIEVGVVAND